MKFHPSAVAGPAGARKLISLIKTYMDMGGSHIQFNIVSSDTLRQAKAMPEDYKALTVRVAGFSAYFTRLHPASRTKSSLVPNSNCRGHYGNHTDCIQKLKEFAEDFDAPYPRVEQLTTGG